MKYLKQIQKGTSSSFSLCVIKLSYCTISQVNKRATSDSSEAKNGRQVRQLTSIHLAQDCEEQYGTKQGVESS